MTYKERPVPLVNENGYAVYELEYPVSRSRQDTHTLWGPDIAGRFCRIGAYSSLHDAMRAFRTLSKGQASCS